MPYSSTDQTGRTIELNHHPARIVSLVPSQTELLHYLGLEKEVVGITRFCVHPEQWFRNKTRIGGTKSVHLAAVATLQPDLIIANKEENVQEQVEALAAQYPVWVSDIHDLGSALDMIGALGQITGRSREADELQHGIRAKFAALPSLPRPIRTAYLIWQKPYIAAGGDTFIHDMLRCCGLENVFAKQARYPVITVEDILEHNCELLLLSSEPFPFKQSHVQRLQQQLPGLQIRLADGEMFSWYGSRLLLAPDYFTRLLQEIR